MANIAFIGLGTMGSGMAKNLAQAGHTVRGWNRSPVEAPNGVHIVASIQEAADDAEFVLISVTGPQAQESVITNEAGLLECAPRSALIIDATSTDPEITRHFQEAFAEKSVEYVDGPVFGSKNEAAGGELDWLFGGTDAQFQRAKPILDAMSKTVTHVGPVGAAASMKLVGNLMVAAQFLSLAEGLAIARRSGVPDAILPTLLDVVDFGSGLLRANARSAIAGDYTPSFMLKHMLKDAGLAQDLARRAGVPAFGLAAAASTLSAANNTGHGDQNVSALVAWLDENSR
jgi:3-hydroxyisobutyrate dehydrogenase-like beta-hydroxyacid dehydrogenase